MCCLIFNLRGSAVVDGFNDGDIEEQVWGDKTKKYFSRLSTRLDLKLCSNRVPMRSHE